MIEDFKKELKELLEKYNAYLGYTQVGGDDQGVEIDIDVTIKRESYTLSPKYHGTVEARDLED